MIPLTVIDNNFRRLHLFNDRLSGKRRAASNCFRSISICICWSETFICPLWFALFEVQFVCVLLRRCFVDHPNVHLRKIAFDRLDSALASVGCYVRFGLPISNNDNNSSTLYIGIRHTPPHHLCLRATWADTFHLQIRNDNVKFTFGAQCGYLLKHIFDGQIGDAAVLGFAVFSPHVASYIKTEQLNPAITELTNDFIDDSKISLLMDSLSNTSSNSMDKDSFLLIRLVMSRFDGFESWKKNSSSYSSGSKIIIWLSSN